MNLYTTDEYDKIKKAVEKYNFLQLGDDGILEIFCDHHMLSTLRTCEAKFDLEIIQNVVGKGRNWSLDFGVAFHQWMEWFDEAEDKNFTGEWSQHFWINEITAKRWGVDILASGQCSSPNAGDDIGSYIFDRINHATWIARCRKYWEEHQLDQFADQTGFRELNGWPGAMAVLMQYWDKYGNGKERLRTVGNELCFGKDKEVPILSNPYLFKWAPFRCYLTGRIDRIVDNGSVIGPMDRKTHRHFKGDEVNKYKPQDAFMGYIYALRTILPTFSQNRKCDSVIVDLIQLKEPTEKTKNKERFKRTYRQFYDSEFVEFIDRQISTFSALYELVIWGRTPQWNTTACHNQFFRPCPYRLLHEQSPAGRSSIEKSFYQQREKRWNPYPTKDELNLVQLESVIE